MADANVPTFAEFLASRKRLPMTGWGDFVRAHLKAGTFPQVNSWAELRAIVEQHPDLEILKTEARASWLSYERVLRNAAGS